MSTATPPYLVCDHLYKRFGEAVAVDQVSFQIHAGECLGVIGPNGAGKTSTLRMCLGLSR
ncbi:MAG: ATP-binding cassette domain-containing protein, partial [Betaproteobacteria bacterium]|nr:ATP-binding cassette domain-containing protein [Betaproteobacteria bacterium]